jgi:copper transporter 1
MDQTNSSMGVPYFHFTGGDNLYFKSWHPSSPGAVAGASIALVILAILERLLNATRGVLDARWRRRYGLYDYFWSLPPHCWLRALALNAAIPAGDGAFQEKESAQVEVIGSTEVSPNAQGIRTLPPFVLYRDAARGALYSLQASLVYALMLAVM